MVIESPSLTISKIRVTQKHGMALRVDDFGPGLNIIRGDNSSGRTTLLKLFEFAFGSKTLKLGDFIPEIRECEKVVLEVKINDSPYTLERNFKGAGQIEIYRGEIDEFPRPYPTAFTPGQDISNFLLNRLNIPIITAFDEFSGNEKSITFEDIYIALYLDQDAGFSKIHARLGQSQRENVFKLLTKTSSPEMYAVNLEIEAIKKRCQDMVAELEAIERFLGEVKLLMPNEIQIRSDGLKKQKEELQKELIDIKEKLRAQPHYADPLRIEILTIEGELNQHKQDLYFARQTLNSYNELQNQLHDDLDKSERVRISSFLLSSFDFDLCPRCLQKITPEMQQRELRNECSLCNRPLLQSVDDVESLEGYQRQIYAQLDELSELQNQYLTRIRKIEESITISERLLAEKRFTFDTFLSEYVSPVIRNVEIITNSIGEADQELRFLEEQSKWRSQVQRMQTKLMSLETTLGDLRIKQERLREEEKGAEMRLSYFETFLGDFLKATYPGEIAAVSISRSNFLPLINRHAYNSKSATEKNVAIIGYYYALLRFSLEQSSNFPRLLIIDTLRQDDLEPHIYENILKQFKNLETKYDKAFQVFLIIRERFDDLIGNEKLRIVEGEHLLQITNL